MEIAATTEVEKGRRRKVRGIPRGGAFPQTWRTWRGLHQVGLLWIDGFWELCLLLATYIDKIIQVMTCDLYPFRSLFYSSSLQRILTSYCGPLVPL